MKRRIVIAFLIGFALWPAVRRGLVAAFDVNPWKIAGWAMYARPHFPSRLAVRLEQGETERPLIHLDARGNVLAAEYLERRFSSGRLASPDALAHHLLAQHPEADAVVIETRTRVFDLESAKIRRDVDRRIVPRGG